MTDIIHIDLLYYNCFHILSIGYRVFNIVSILYVSQQWREYRQVFSGGLKPQMYNIFLIKRLANLYSHFCT